VTTRQKIFIALAAVGLIHFFFLIVFGEKGFTDYLSLKSQKKQVLNENEALVKKNISLYRKIERLKQDPRYMEFVIRKDLGVLGKNEIIFKKRPKKEEAHGLE
jgi:cell division protein FtsB